MRIQHQVVSLDKILEYYALGFESRKGESKPIYRDAYVDIQKRKVIFELAVENDQDLDTAKELKRQADL